MKDTRQDAGDIAPFVTLVHETEGVPVLKASGELDLAASDRFRDAIEESLGAISRDVSSTASNDGYSVFVVDLSGVVFMDSCGINALVGGTRAFVDDGGLVRIVTKGSPAARTLSVTGLDRIFSVYPDVGSAARRGVA